MGHDIRPMRLEELKDIYKRIEDDFASGEYPPYRVLYGQLESDAQTGRILIENGNEVAYSICAEGGTKDFVLISLLAVYREFRGRGFGTAFLEVLKDCYSDKKGVIVEVEKPEDAKTKEERDIRIKRIGFYEKAGFRLLPDIDYTIWDVPMHLMVLSAESPQNIINKEVSSAMHDIYLKLMGEQFIHKMVLEIKQ
ncbi:MAG TPA: GNAT family N-acetyltransferase [Ruminiclostridium sp.]|nr:GNAT family N-acetyltransferase [Ruminiclostridium sp.]